MNPTYSLPPVPRASIDPRTKGLRTFDSHTGKSKPVTVDNHGNYVYAPTIYVILAALLLGMIVAGLVLKRTRPAG